VSPKARNWLPDSFIIRLSVLVDKLGVTQLSLGRRVDAMDLAMSQMLQFGQAQPLGQRIHLRVLEEMVSLLVHICVETALEDKVLGLTGGTRDKARIVLVGVEVLEEGADGVGVVGEFDDALGHGGRVREVSTGFGEPGGFLEQREMRGEGGVADLDGDDWRLEVAGVDIVSGAKLRWW
jgi:hypothetical protein